MREPAHALGGDAASTLGGRLAAGPEATAQTRNHRPTPGGEITITITTVAVYHTSNIGDKPAGRFYAESVLGSDRHGRDCGS